MRGVKRGLLVLSVLAVVLPLRAEVLLQYFETEWDEIYRRLPEIGEIGYEGLWTPPPSKSPAAGGQFAGGGNVGYSGYDRFDIGDVPQRGSLGTRYGTRGALRNLVDSAHQSDIRVYPDIVFNHSGNGPDYRTYPGTKPNDYHGWFDGGQPGGFKRAPRMNNYGEINDGFGRTFQEELVSLFDLALEADQRFSSGAPNYAAWPAPFVRQPGWDERYPFNGGTNVPENVVQFMSRWINWLGYAMDFDGVRLDAPKHCIADFLGTPGAGFLHEVQWNFQNRRGYTTPDEFSDLYRNDVRRRNALIFGEFFIGGVGEVDYWRFFGGQGVKLRYLDFPRKSQMIWPAFNSGNLAALSGFSGFSDQEGILFCQSHDESPPSKLELAYAYVLTHVGLPVVYFTGNNLNGSDVNVKTWLKIGHGAALGDYNNNALPNLVYIHNQFARGREWERWSEGDFYAFERYDDLNGNQTPQSPEGLLLVGLNDSGAWQTRNGVQTAFNPLTVLHDYTGAAPDITVKANGTVDLAIPAGQNGQGWVCYAPYNAAADGDPLRFAGAGAMNWVVPGGALTVSKPRQVARVTGDAVDIDVHFAQPAGGAADNVLVKWGEGRDLSPAAADHTGQDLLTGGFEQASIAGPGHWRLSATITNVPEGLHLVKARVFNQRPGGYPALFQTFAESVYVDRRGPDLDVVTPAGDAVVPGSVVAEIRNPDWTAYSVDVSIDGGATNAATEVMKGHWRFALPALSAGAHTMQVRALEADWGSPRQVINTSVVARAFSVSPGGPALDIGFSPGATVQLPFFTTTVLAPGLGPNDVKLYWDGFEMAGLTGTGTLTHVFDGRYVAGGVTQRLYGAFVNGPHFFEARAVSDGQTRSVARRVTFNLYGNNQVDSDGDGLPDNVEMPNFSGGTAPGPNVPWPGDPNQDMIPNYGETWSRLNPMNAETFYGGVWDGDLDSDGDGFSNLCEVRQGFLEHADAYYFNIYSAGSRPGSCESGPQPSAVAWSPANPTRCDGNTLTITYAPNGGPLSNAAPVQIHFGYNAWTNPQTGTMSNIGGGQWQYVVVLPDSASVVDFSFRNEGGAVWDNNGGADWHVPVGPCVVITNYFAMDGQFDGANGGADYEVANSGMRILAAVKGDNLYAATWSANGNASGADHVLFITDGFSAPQPTPWGKAGDVYFDKARAPHLCAESEGAGGFVAFNNSGTGGRSAMGPGGAALEGEINLLQVFGYLPDTLYLAAVAYGDANGGGILSQCPPAWDAGDTLETTEFVPVPVASIRDEDLDGVFDVGKPQMWTVVNGNTNDANYNLRRIFLDERAGDAQDITVILQPNAPGGSNVVSDVELFSNLNRREFAVLPGDEDPDSVTAASDSTYFRAYPMTALGGGRYAATIRATRCGAYRINARYRINGRRVYYTDHGLRRDCAVVVSPKKALALTMYEVQPMIAEATGTTFYDRSTFRDLHVANTNKPDYLNTNHFTSLGVNMIWLQPIHPIGSDNRQTDPETGQPFDPGSPYAVRNYWKVNPVLGDPATEQQAMAEFTGFVGAMDAAGVGVMLDGTFNHSAWDCEIGDVGAAMFDWATNATDLIRTIRPEWYSRKGDYGRPASYYRSTADNDVAQAPDRFDFGKWPDVADFFFGTYDALVQGQTDEWRHRHQAERDRFDGFGASPYTRDLWRYFAHYPIYWIEKTGHPAGTPAGESWRGIDGLRCDFAQGLPSEFWEYCINRTRSVKWDFLFMAESLDGSRTVGGNPRHGIGYRSSRHFDILNENFVFYWRDQFFAYPANGPGSAGAPNPATFPTFQALDARRNAFDVSPLLLNLTSHDEVYPSDDPYRVLYAYAELAALDGIPMLFYGQEAGALNSREVYGFTGGIPDDSRNFARYEVNFGKGIPNFKRYNCMTNVWLNRDWNLQFLYGRVNRARAESPALRSQGLYFLSRTGGQGYDPDIFAAAKFEQPGVSAATQEVVFAFVNNNYAGSENRWATYDLNASYDGRNWFGIEEGRNYNVVDLLSSNPAATLWTTNRTGADLLANGITVGLTAPASQGGQAQYLKLVDAASSYPDHDGDGVPDFSDWDDDNDGLPDGWEIAKGLDPLSAVGDNGAGGDPDDDRASNLEEYLAGTHPVAGGDALRIRRLEVQGGGVVRVEWPAVPERNYAVEHAPGFSNGEPPAWQRLAPPRTALAPDASEIDAPGPDVSNRLYRVVVKP